MQIFCQPTAPDALPALASHTYYVTSSYILCHIIIHTMSHHHTVCYKIATPSAKDELVYILHMSYILHVFYVFCKHTTTVTTTTALHLHARTRRASQRETGREEGRGAGSGGEESIRGKRRKRHANTTWTHIDAWRVWLAQCRRNGLARRGQ